MKFLTSLKKYVIDNYNDYLVNWLHFFLLIHNFKDRHQTIVVAIFWSRVKPLNLCYFPIVLA